MTLPSIDTSYAQSELEHTVLELVTDGMMTQQIMSALGITRDSIETIRRDLRQRGAAISTMPVTANKALRCRDISNLMNRHVVKGKDARKLASEQGRSVGWLNAMTFVYREAIANIAVELTVDPKQSKTTT